MNDGSEDRLSSSDKNGGELENVGRISLSFAQASQRAQIASIALRFNGSGQSFCGSCDEAHGARLDWLSCFSLLLGFRHHIFLRVGRFSVAVVMVMLAAFSVTVVVLC